MLASGSPIEVPPEPPAAGLDFALGKAMETNPQLSNMMTPFLPTWAIEPEASYQAASLLATNSRTRA